MPKKSFDDVTAIVFAAGLGTRMKTEKPKVMHTLFDKPLIEYVVDATNKAGIESIILVVGYGKELIEKQFKDTNISFVVQKQLLGTADALKTALPKVPKSSKEMLILCGDAPLISAQTLKNVVKTHTQQKAQCTILTATVSDPTGYGRIVRDEKGNITNIVEELDTTVFEKQIAEINSGVYCLDLESVKKALSSVKPINKKKEYYLTDIVDYLYRQGKKVVSFQTSDEYEIMGINSRTDLAECQSELKYRFLEELMEQGVTVVDPTTTFIDPSAKIKKDTTILPFCVIEKNVSIGKNCVIGPFAHIRAKTQLSDDVQIGAFVEVNRSKISQGSKAKHLTYLGDAVIGKNVNIGAGTIVANYDGKTKSQTKIKDKAFIGSGTILVAPVEVGVSSMTGAGSVVTKNHNVKNGKVVVGVPARELKKTN